MVNNLEFRSQDVTLALQSQSPVFEVSWYQEKKKGKKTKEKNLRRPIQRKTKYTEKKMKCAEKKEVAEP